MANIHVLDRDGSEFRVVVHIPIPNTLNSAGVSWRDALINSGIGGKTVLPDGNGTGGTIIGAEKVQIVSGALYEVEDRLKPDSNNPDKPGDAAYLQAAFAVIRDRDWPLIQARLKWFGVTNG